MSFMAVLESVKAVRQRCCKVQEKQPATMAFWFSMCGVGTMSTGCVVLGWWQTRFYPGARCRWLDTTQRTNLGTAHARLQQTAGVAHWSTSQTAVSANTGPDGVVIHPKPPAEKSWPMNCELCFLPFFFFLFFSTFCAVILPLILWFDLWACFVLWTSCLSFLTRSSNKKRGSPSPVQIILQVRVKSAWKPNGDDVAR